jgi:hypothetical protein
MKYTRQATVEDMHYLSTRLRKADVREVEALGYLPLESLLQGLRDSSKCLVMAPGGKPVGVYGICPTASPAVGLIWMLATPELEAHQMKFLRHSKKAVSDLMGDYELVYNYTDVRNTLHHSWLKWCGAVALSKHPLGISGEEFIEFVIRK